MSTVKKIEFPIDPDAPPPAPFAPVRRPRRRHRKNPDANPLQFQNRIQGACKQPLAWNPMAYMDDYLENLTIDGRVVTYTSMVRVGLNHFSRFAAAEGLKHPDEIQRQHILRFQAYLQNEARTEGGEPFAASYRRKLMCYLRGWINWMDDLDHIEINPWVRIKIGSTPKKPNPLEDDEIAQLFEAHRRQAFTMTPFAFHRREVILVLLYGWGLRIHELESLNVSQMDMRLDFVRVKNKGSQTPKPLPYGRILKDSVQRWLIWRAREVEMGEDALLIDANSGTRLSISRIREIVINLGDRANVSVNPHRFRDSLGTKLIDSDVSVERVMQVFGHTNRAQTLAYTKLGDRKVKEEHERVMDPILSALLETDLPDTKEIEPPPGWPRRKKNQ